MPSGLGMFCHHTVSTRVHCSHRLRHDTIVEEEDKDRVPIPVDLEWDEITTQDSGRVRVRHIVSVYHVFTC